MYYIKIEIYGQGFQEISLIPGDLLGFSTTTCHLGSDHCWTESEFLIGKLHVTPLLVFNFNNSVTTFSDIVHRGCAMVAAQSELD